MKRKIGIAIMFGLICINILSGCGPSSNEKQTDFEELEVDYVINIIIEIIKEFYLK